MMKKGKIYLKTIFCRILGSNVNNVLLIQIYLDLYLFNDFDLLSTQQQPIYLGLVWEDSEAILRFLVSTFLNESISDDGSKKAVW